MIVPRVIPTLLLSGRKIVKTTKFKNPVYIGDPVNTVKIFNDKEVDEIALLDISATNEKRPPQFDLLKEIASECFIPLAYGGGVRDLATAKEIFSIGFEKVILGTAAARTPNFIRELSDLYGAQAVMISIDVAKPLFGDLAVYTNSGKSKTKGRNLEEYVRHIQEQGAGEILLTSIDREGTMDGYDLDLIQRVAKVTTVPLVAAGGAGSITDFRKAIDAGANAAAAGSLFVFSGSLRGVLISYPTRKEIEEVFER